MIVSSQKSSTVIRFNRFILPISWWMCPSLYMLLYTYVILSTLNFCSAFIISVVMLYGPAAFPPFLLLMALSAPALVIGEPFLFLRVGFLPLLSSSRLLIYSGHFLLLPQETKHSEFVALPKKAKTTDCLKYEYVTKIILIVNLCTKDSTWRWLILI